jgi:hypothetical protein
MTPTKLPRKLAKYRGRQYWKFFVVASQSGLNRTLWEHARELPIIATSASEAVNTIREEVAPKVDYPTEIECLGPKGGIVHRFIGYESLIWAKMGTVRGEYEQLKLV